MQLTIGTEKEWFFLESGIHVNSDAISGTPPCKIEENPQ